MIRSSSLHHHRWSRAATASTAAAAAAGTPPLSTNDHFYNNHNNDVDATIAARPSSGSDMLLLFTGVFLQVCCSESKLLNFILWGGGNYDNRPNQPLQTPIDIQMLTFLASWVRSILAMLVLVLVRNFVMANLSPIRVPTSYLDTHDGHRMLIQDLLLHIKCRFYICTVLCLLPSSEYAIITDATTNCLVLVATTLNQPVFQREFQRYQQQHNTVVVGRWLVELFG